VGILAVLVVGILAVLVVGILAVLVVDIPAALAEDNLDVPDNSAWVVLAEDMPVEDNLAVHVVDSLAVLAPVDSAENGLVENSPAVPVVLVGGIPVVPVVPAVPVEDFLAALAGWSHILS
jgi:hypothetical protein